MRRIKLRMPYVAALSLVPRANIGGALFARRLQHRTSVRQQLRPDFVRHTCYAERDLRKFSVHVHVYADVGCRVYTVKESELISRPDFLSSFPAVRKSMLLQHFRRPKVQCTVCRVASEQAFAFHAHSVTL